jgi:hypothetical protein
MNTIIASSFKFICLLLENKIYSFIENRESQINDKNQKRNHKERKKLRSIMI